MNALRDHVLLYDEVCPLCSAYSGAFVRSGMLDREGRKSYQAMDEGLKACVDPQRAVDEIALVDRRTGQVTYGVASLMAILQHSFPALAPLLRLRAFVWLAEKAYRFVSFNRRVIMPARDSFRSQPSFNARYRLAYLVFAWLVTAACMNSYSRLLKPLIPTASYGRDFLICGGQIFWQLGFLALLRQGRRWDYLGSLMTISLGGGILLAVIQLLTPSDWSPLLFGALFTAVAGGMFFEHIRRTRILAVSSWLTASWVLYRVLLLGVILWR